MIIGVTGSRFGPTERQSKALRPMFRTLLSGQELEDVELWHGGCQGWDATMHRFGLAMGLDVHMLPGTDSQGNSPYRMTCPSTDNFFIHEADLYKIRNQYLAKSCDVLVAGPMSPEGDDTSKRSGTWQTVRIARACRKPIVLIYPDGRVIVENG